MKFVRALTGAGAAGAMVAEWPLHAQAAFYASDVAWTLGGLFAVLTLTRAVRVSAAAERGIWSALAIAACAWLLGQVAWDLNTVFGHVPPSPSIADCLWLLFPLVAAVGIHRFAPVPTRVRRVLDVDAAALAICVGALTIAYNWAALASSTGTIAARATSVAYPVSYASVVALGLGVLIAVPEIFRRREFVLVLGGIVVEGLAFVLWCPQVLDGSYRQGASLLDPLWTLGLLLMGTGALAVGRERPSFTPSSDRLRRRTLLPAAGFAALVGMLVFFAVTNRVEPAPRLTLLTAVGVMGLLFVARNWLAFAAVEGLERERAAALVRRNSELEAFAYSASHDLKAPLVSIEGFAALLGRELGENLDERTRHYLTRISANALSMQQLIVDLFAFARSGGDERDAVPVDTNALARDIAQEWRDRADAAGMRLQVDSSLPSVHAHPVRLKQALTNLVDNGIRYGSGHVRVTGSARGGVAELVVEDGGRGVPVEERERMFDVFARGIEARRSAPEGTGLGLALVKRIAESNGGELSYESVPRSRFVLRFPEVAS